MTKSVMGASLVLLAAGGVAFYAQADANRGLRRDVAALREDVRALAMTAKVNAAAAARAQSSASVLNAVPGSAALGSPSASEDLAKLRDEIVALRKSTTALTQLAQTAQAAQALAKTSESVATQLVPAAQWRNAGKGTPEATTETVLWAALGGDVDTLAGALTFTPSAKAKADAWFAGLSDTTRQQYGSPEKVIALMVAQESATLSGMQVLGRKEIGADDVGVRVRFGGGEGKVKDDTFVMHRASDGWRMVLPDKTVEKFARQLGGK